MRVNAGSRHAALEHGELLAQGEVLEGQGRTREQKGARDVEDQHAIGIGHSAPRTSSQRLILRTAAGIPRTLLEELKRTSALMSCCHSSTDKSCVCPASCSPTERSDAYSIASGDASRGAPDQHRHRRNVVEKPDPETARMTPSWGISIFEPFKSG
ncbi:MAG: hypothetical protein ABI054_06140 [Planctomycetota bacterium]